MEEFAIIELRCWFYIYYTQIRNFVNLAVVYTLTHSIQVKSNIPISKSLKLIWDAFYYHSYVFFASSLQYDNNDRLEKKEACKR